MVVWQPSEFLLSVLMRQSPQAQLPGLKLKIQLAISHLSIQNGEMKCGSCGRPTALVFIKVLFPLICFKYMTHVSASDGTPDGSEGEKENSWAVIEVGEKGYPILPARPLDASLQATRRVLRTWVNKVYRE